MEEDDDDDGDDDNLHLVPSWRDRGKICVLNIYFLEELSGCISKFCLLRVC